VKKKPKVGSRGEHLWRNIPGFMEWFKVNAPKLTNPELQKALQDRFHVEVSRVACESLRRSHGAVQDSDTRRRAFAARNTGYGVTPDDRTMSELRDANRSLMRKMEEQRVTKAELVAAVYNAAKDASTSLEIGPVKKPSQTKDRKDRQNETAILVVSDQQLGKRTPTYSSEICEERMERYMDKVHLLTEIQRSYHPVRTARIYLLGDIIEGEMIFPGQAHRIDSSLFRQVSVDGPRIISNVVRRALGMFEQVHVVGVIGNHGRIGRRGDFHPESNGDLMLYRNMQTIFEVAKEPRVSFDIPYLRGERSWYSVDTIGNHKYFLFHGDQMRGGGFGGLPYYGFGRAVNNWAAGVIPEGFKYALCGHWHQMASIPINDRILWVNGSTESSNEWLREELKSQSPPGQWLLFAHPEIGVTAEYRVWLTR
jgi:hypothetical protein